MKGLSSQPARDSRSDSQCQDPSTERIEMAIALCRARGVKLTALRQKVLELLWQNDRPSGAYQLIKALALANKHPVAPPTVYRALDFLIAQGLASKLESCNAYVPCAHPERDHSSIFLICSACGTAAELEDPQIEQQLTADAAQHFGFQVTRRVVEVQGMCKACIAAATT